MTLSTANASDGSGRNFTKSNPLYSSRGCAIALFLSVFWSCFVGGSALKHNFRTAHDERSLIGPIGFPFGFVDRGVYNLTVWDFQIKEGKHVNDDAADDDTVLPRQLDEESPARNQQEQDYPRRLKHFIEKISAVGFLLKRFSSEQAFNQFMAELEEGQLCALNIPSIDGEPLGDDGYGVDDDWVDVDLTINAGEEGIFLSMKEDSHWAPNTPSAEYKFRKGEEGLYFLIYQICPPPPPELDIHSGFELDFHFINVDMFGNESHLSAGEMNLPHLFFYFSILYAICLYLWWTNIRHIKAGGAGHWPNPNPSAGQPVVYPIHYLMSALLLLKTLSIFFESIRYHYIRVSGKAVLWSAVYYTFSFMKGTFLFTVILLIGSGWSFVKPFLNNRERNMILGILILQVINNIAIIVLTQEAEGERSFDRWTGILHMVDILCCCAVLIPIVWQVNQLEKNIEQANGDHNDTDDDSQIPEDEFDEAPARSAPPDGRLVSKLRLFRGFYLLVVSYIYATRIVVYLFATMLDYRHVWLRHFVVEAVTLAFYCMVGMQFRPMGENPYLSVRKDEDLDGTAVEQLEIELTT